MKMKRLEELGISPTPWTVEYDSTIDRVVNIIDANGEIIVETDYGFYPPKLADARMTVAAPGMYERLRLSTNMINHAVQFVKNIDIKNALRKLADENRAALAKAAGESEVAK